jgi:outer membrane protein assembly factor BamB
VYNGDFVWEYKIKTKKFNFGKIFGIKSRQTDDCKGIIIKDNILVFADSEGFLNALSLDNGKEIWSYKIQESYSLFLSLYNEKLFVGVKNNLYCLNIFNGNKLSKLNYKYYINTFISVDNDIMYFGTDFNFYAIELNTNKVLWEHKIESVGYINFESPAICKDRIVLAYHEDFDIHCNAYLCCLNKNNGNVLWTYDDVFNFIHSGPVISNGCVYFGCEDFHSREYYFCVLDLETGKELSRFETKGSIEVDPAFYDNMVVIGCDDGNLYAFE